jgi:hypothetical protein
VEVAISALTFPTIRAVLVRVTNFSRAKLVQFFISLFTIYPLWRRALHKQYKIEELSCTFSTEIVRYLRPIIELEDGQLDLDWISIELEKIDYSYRGYPLTPPHLLPLNICKVDKSGRKWHGRAIREDAT